MSLVELVDSHCHLADDVFGADLEGVVQRARAAGLTRALCILDPGSPGEAARVPRIRELWPAVRFSAGVHPHHAGKYADDPSRAPALVRAAIEANSGVTCALGEIGLDYHYDFSPREVQQEVFRLQLELARTLDLPVIIHTREADADTLRILHEVNAADISAAGVVPAGRVVSTGGGVPAARAGGPLRGVFHCFTGDEALARGALELGFYVSFSGIATFPKAEPLRQVARLVPADRRLVETDSPYLAPPPHRGKRNEPAWVARVAEIVGEAVGEPLEAFAAQTTRNFAALFDARQDPA
jgi:TatD DNase family protein